VNRRRSPFPRLFARFFRLVWGDEIDPPLRPLQKPPAPRV